MLSLFRPKGEKQAIQAIHATLVSISRQPIFYLQGQVPDSIDGRFELLALHVALVLRRLRGQDNAFAQSLFNYFFAQLDLNLREMGIGDTGVSKRMRHMGKSFYGRMVAYDTPDDAALHEALSRNLFGTLLNEPPESITQPFVTYIRRSEAALAQQSLAKLGKGLVDFPSFQGAV